MLVHFPIALALVALLFNLAEYLLRTKWLDKASITLTVLAALGAIAALLSGIFFTNPTAGLAATLKAEHFLYAGIATGLLTIASFFGVFILKKHRNSSRQGLFFTVLLIASAIAVSLTGIKGGSIVYDVWLF